MKLNFLKKIFKGFGVVLKPMMSRLKTAFLEGKLLELISTSSINFLSAVGGVGLAYLFVKTIVRKIIVKTSDSVMEEAKQSKKSVTSAITEAVNRDQDVNQDIARYGYTEKDLEKHPEVKVIVDKFNKAKGRIPAEDLENVKGKKQKRHACNIFRATDDFGNVVFIRQMKPGETKEDMSRILSELCSRGWIGGPWSTNRYKDRIKAIYG